MADDFSNLTDIIQDTAEPQVRPRRYGDAMIRLRGIYTQKCWRGVCRMHLIRVLRLEFGLASNERRHDE